MKTFVVIFVLITASCASKKTPAISDVTQEFVFDCKADREVIAAYEYLRQHPEFALNEFQMRETALKVSEGCTGSAESFVNIAEVLLKAKLDGRSALSEAKDLAASGTRRAEAFLVIFRRAYASEALDLDLRQALLTSKALSINYAGDAKTAAADFQKLSHFCRSRAGEGLSRPNCAALIERVILSNSKANQAIADRFTDLFSFLTDPQAVNLTAGDALSIAEKLAATSPDAIAVFRKTYEFAESKTGLGLQRADAVSFAVKAASNTKQPMHKI
jgi:hypothetical protein